MSYAEVAEKFRLCAEAAHWPTPRADAIVKAVRRFDTLADVSELTAMASER